MAELLLNTTVLQGVVLTKRQNYGIIKSDCIIASNSTEQDLTRRGGKT